MRPTWSMCTWVTTSARTPSTGKVTLQPVRPGPFAGGFRPLEQAAVHQQRLPIGQAELVARSR
jgi:hypothetical protein